MTRQRRLPDAPALRLLRKIYPLINKSEDDLWRNEPQSIII
jgi:hypothetical protein